MIQLLPKTIGLLNVNLPPKYITCTARHTIKAKPWRWSSMQTSRIPFPFLLSLRVKPQAFQPYMPVIHFINSLYNLRGKHNIDQKNSRMMHLTFLTTSIYEKVLLVWSSSYKKKVNNHFCRHWKCNSRINISLKDENIKFSL